MAELWSSFVIYFVTTFFFWKISVIQEGLPTPATTATTTSAAPTCPHVIPRDQWHARPSKSIEILPKQPVPYAFIHHSALPECFNETDCAAAVRSYQNLHMDTNGWDDIGYSFVIGGDGSIFEGRGWDRVGAHTGGFNTVGLGFCLIGNFMEKLPTDVQVKAVKDLIACGVSLNKIEANYTLRGHRDMREGRPPTDCPGDMFYKEIQTWPHYTPLTKGLPTPPTTVTTITSAAPTCPHIIPRDQWHARPSKSIEILPKQPVPYAFIHHSAMPECFNQSDCAAAVRSYQNFHMDTNGWDDIGYSFIIGGDGSVFEGRGWDRVGAHTLGYNSVGLGFCLIGNFMEKLPTDVQVKAVRDLIVCGVSLNKIEANYTLRGHRDMREGKPPTDCPGDMFYKEIQTWPHY